MDADSELLLVLTASGQREEPARLNNVLEDVIAGLEDRESQQLQFVGELNHSFSVVVFNYFGFKAFKVMASLICKL